MAGVLWGLVLLFAPAPPPAQAEAGAPPREQAAEDEETPGLVAEYTGAGGAPVVMRLEPDLAYDWGPGAPDARLPAEGFSARWTGLLLVQTPGEHRFQARTDGQVRLAVGGHVVVDGRDAAVKSSAVTLEAGFTPLVVEYHHLRGPARLAIDWEGPGFAREPLPARLVFHAPGERAKAAAADRFEEGRRLADRLGCANCHSLLDLPRHPDLAPALEDAGTSIDPAWMAAWLANPAGVRPSTRMPAFGAGLKRGEVADLIAWLRQVQAKARPVTNEIKMALNVAEPARGRLVFRSVGCLGCHSRGGKLAQSHDRAAPDLTDVGAKRSPTWLAAFLAHPKGTAGSPHRADLDLTADEAAHVAAYLASDPPPRPPAPAPALADGDVARGRTLARRLRCAACHVVPREPAPAADVPLRAGSNAQAGCLADAPAEGVPRFALTEAEREALRFFVAKLPPEPSPTPPQTLAFDAMRRRNCLGCHARDGQGGSWLGTQVAEALESDPALATLKGTLAPPNLSAVGDKLRADYLALAVRGQAPTARPWLSVRMPAFPFAAGEAEGILTALRQHDRLDPDAAKEPPPTPTHPDARTVEQATSLIGQRGFGCVSCHVLAGKIPPGGEPETLGPDLALAHKRMTERYFHRWIANPQRIIPGTPMPQFVKPLPGTSGTLEDQLGAIWQLLGSPRLAELAAFSTRERLRPQGGRVMVVRDMVLVPQAPGGPYHPRGLAFGFKNGHSVLFDADRLRWVAWWRGGFLYRTKAGRLWEWHPEGETLWVAPDRGAPVVFLGPDGEPAAPAEVRERFGHFADLVQDGDGVRFSYVLNGPQGAAVRVEEQLTPTDVGLERTVRVTNVPRGYQPALALHPPALAEAASQHSQLKWSAPDGPARLTLHVKSGTLQERKGGESPAFLVLMQPENDHASTARLSLAASPPVSPPAGR